LGVEQLANVAPSIEHSNVAPVGSLEVNAKVGVASFVTRVGSVVIVAVGGAASTIQVYEAGLLEWLPA
jgi:hypothetical protein